MLFVLEMTNFMVSVIGLRYAAASAARSAIVWLPAEMEESFVTGRGLNKIRHATVAAWMPYMPGHIKQVPTQQNSSDVTAYIEALHRSQVGQVKKSYLSRQYALAGELQIDLEVENSGAGKLNGPPFSFDSRTQVTFLGKQDQAGKAPRVTATVTGPIPFKTSFIGRMFGTQLWPGVGIFAREVTVSYSLPMEMPLSDSGSIGLPGYYDTRF